MDNIELSKKQCVKTALIYSVFTVFCALFGGVYELFSHGVYSYFMLYAFVFPLVLGTIPFLILYNTSIRINRLSSNLYHCGVATLTVGSHVKGVLDIYGTTNSLCILYWIFGITLVVSGILIFALKLKRN